MAVFRFLIFAVALFLAGTSLAQSPLDPAQKDETAALNLALKYYDRCMEVRDESVSHNTQQRTCACMAEQARASLTLPEISYLAGDKENGTEVPKGKAFVSVFGPCLQYPAWEYVYYECYNSDITRKAFNDFELFKYNCGCRADAAGTYFAETAPAQLAAMLQFNPTIEDPLSAILEGLDYKEESQKMNKKCYVEAKGYDQ